MTNLLIKVLHAQEPSEQRAKDPGGLFLLILRFDGAWTVMQKYGWTKRID